MGDHLRILLVEDDATSARTLARMLREDGFDVELAFDGAAAIGRLGRDPFADARVVDYRLPHVDGLVVASYARSLRPQVPVVIVTSYPEILRYSDSRLNPPAVMLTKPLIYRDLTTELAHLQSA